MPAALFSERFMDVVVPGIDRHSAAVRRMVGLLDVTVEWLEGLFASRGFERRVEL